MLRILHKKYGIKCDEYGMYIVAKTNRTDVLKYLMDEQGLYGTSIILNSAIRLKCNEVVNFLVSRGIYGTLEGWTHPLPKNFYSLNA